MEGILGRYEFGLIILKWMTHVLTASMVIYLTYFSKFNLLFLLISFGLIGLYLMNRSAFLLKKTADFQLVYKYLVLLFVIGVFRYSFNSFTSYILIIQLSLTVLTLILLSILNKKKAPVSRG